jgi:cell division protein FtsQ
MIISQVRKHYKDFKLSWKLTMKVLGFIVFIYFLSYLFNHSNIAHYFPIKEVKITGLHHTDQHQVQRLLQPLVKKSFFSIKVEEIKWQLHHLPWVSDVSVRRVWPNQIAIQVVEKIPLARWNDSGLISVSGDIFQPPPNSYPPGLPQLTGPMGNQMQMLNYYEIIKTVIAPHHFKIAQLELTPGKSWSVTLTNGIKLNLGYKDILTRIGHFVKVYPKIVGNRTNEVDYIDLRYSNGMAVRWKA